MNAGEYKDYLRVKKQSVAVDEVGEAVETLTPDTYVWGQINPQGSVQTEEAGRRASYRDAQIKIRFFPGIVALDQLIELDGTTWIIRSISKDDDGLNCECVTYA